MSEAFVIVPESNGVMGAAMNEVHQIPEWNRNVEALPCLGEEPSIHPTATVRDCRMGRYVEIGAFAELVKSEIGDYSYVAEVHSALFNTELGKFCSVASSVRINPVMHPMDRPTQHHCTYRRRQYGFDQVEDEALFAWRLENRCIIGHDVWIGHGATIMPGVSVGTGAVIGSGAVVTKDVQPYEIVGGVPARQIRFRFPEAQRERLLASCWWDWSHEELTERFPELLDWSKFQG